MNTKRVVHVVAVMLANMFYVLFMTIFVLLNLEHQWLSTKQMNIAAITLMFLFTFGLTEYFKRWLSTPDKK